MNGSLLHPRPQLTRQRWTNLGGAWQFAHDDANVGLRDGWSERAEPFTRTIIVPFPPESTASGVGETGYHPVVWYRRAFRVEPEDRTERLLLRFGAVDYRARVWVNGQLVAVHEGGHTPFSADIAPALRDGDAEQIVVVRAEDQPRDLAQPRGKQDWERDPHRIWYHRTTGIWQPVWLEPLPPIAIADVRWTPDVDRGQLALRVTLNAAPARSLRLRVRLTLRDETLADDSYAVASQEIERTLALDLDAQSPREHQRFLWSPEHPNLIDAELTLLDGDQTIDSVASYAGLRSVDIADGRFLLNGQPYYLRLVLEQGYWPESHLAAPNAEALRREVELTKALGFNGARIHQKIEDPRFLYWCDRLGLLIWGEMANARVFTPTAVERLTREWLEALRRDYSHPCIVAWVPLNESWGVPNLERDPAQQDFVRALYALTRALDPTRPVIGNDGWEHLVGDILGIHDYALDGATLRERFATPEAVARTLRIARPHTRTMILPGYEQHGQPLMLTEFGGITDAPQPGKPWFGYGTAATPEELLAKYEEVVAAVLDSTVIMGFCYTQLTDTLQETNGLLTAERQPKIDLAAARAITTRPSRALPAALLASVRAAAEATAARDVKGERLG